jgi:hypothetical protein
MIAYADILYAKVQLYVAERTVGGLEMRQLLAVQSLSKSPRGSRF